MTNRKKWLCSKLWRKKIFWCTLDVENIFKRKTLKINNSLCGLFSQKHFGYRPTVI